MVQGDVVADLRRFADDHAHAVVDEEALADRRPGWISMPVRLLEIWEMNRASVLMFRVHSQCAA